MVRTDEDYGDKYIRKRVYLGVIDTWGREGKVREDQADVRAVIWYQQKP